jgi:hypothetical protein
LGKPIIRTDIKNNITFKLSIEDFDKRGDIKMTGYIGKRGREVYK